MRGRKKNCTNSHKKAVGAIFFHRPLVKLKLLSIATIKGGFRAIGPRYTSGWSAGVFDHPLDCKNGDAEPSLIVAIERFRALRTKPHGAQAKLIII